MLNYFIIVHRMLNNNIWVFDAFKLEPTVHETIRWTVYICVY